MAVKWKWKPAAGGSVPSNLEQRIQAVETKATTNETNITTLRTDLNAKIQKRVLDITNTRGQTYDIRPSSGYEIISVMAGRKRTAEGYYFFAYQSSLNFQLFVDSNNNWKLYTEGAVSGFDGNYRLIIVEKKL